MQKSFVLRPDERQQASRMEEENRSLLAQYGALELQRKAIKKRLPALEEEQRKFLREMVSRNGVEQFASARIEGGNLLVEVPEPPPLPDSPAPNGHAGAN